MSSCDTRVLSLLGTQAEGHDNRYDSNTDLQTNIVVEADMNLLSPSSATPTTTPTVVPTTTPTVVSSGPKREKQCNKAFFKNLKEKKNTISEYQQQVLNMKKQKHDKKMEILDIIKEREEYELKIKILQYEEKKNI